ncbi:Protein CBG16116 [Caenorhabditis briggsae]|uniref:Uncharacterized protein n=2 Tax=Caenorhabditis briggsae TaxID=6238 RepID=A0AAE8ZMM4_CAEBR|nr:Protein CBG16116 [Caenorhabditis briggsae]ULT80043.1 hypothetical protein L3Y34_010550 [Caenorhabditis briggsae]CAP34267.1 Protein CBG16116 [Caenorhabditis briggsae]
MTVNEGASSSSSSPPHPSSPSRLPSILECPETNPQDDDFEESEFGELSSAEFTSASYISFGEPTFSSSIFVNLPNDIDPAVMATSQNFNTFNYPVFKKYGYYINGVYYTMVKKGSTRDRPKCLYRRGTPRLATIKEEPEHGDDDDEVHKDLSGKKEDDSNNNF